MAHPIPFVCATVMFGPTPEFEALLDRVRGRPGVYVFAEGPTILRIGEGKDLAERLWHHQLTAQGRFRKEYPGYFDFFSKLLGRRLDISCHLEVGGKDACRALERALIAMQPVQWELAKAHGAARSTRPKRGTSSGTDSPQSLEIKNVLREPARAQVVAPAAGPGESRSLGQIRSLLKEFPGLVEKTDKQGRINFMLGARRVVMQVSSAGHGWVSGEAAAGFGVATNENGHARTRDFDDSALREVVRRSILALATAEGVSPSVR